MLDQGAEIIDINMGCPAKKVCKVAAGSALLRDEALVGRILEAVVRAVPVPVTLKTRTGWSPETRNLAASRGSRGNPASRCWPCTGAPAPAATGAAEFDSLRELRRLGDRPAAGRERRHRLAATRKATGAGLHRRQMLS
jgi:tRNA-dihydrouridine synthase B